MRDNISHRKQQTLPKSHHHHHQHQNQKQRNNKQQIHNNSRHHHNQQQQQLQNVSSSHYSTEKSGSSGYYGSNLYSTSSVDDHIYSEPVMEKYDARKAVLSMSRRPHVLLRHHELAIPTTSCDLANVEENIDILRKKIDKLPTIMEGIDGQIPRPVWPSDYDDSLVDLNLEPFLRNNNNTDNFYGIENPAFSSSDEEYAKHYEETVSFYQTRGILEDIREKLNVMIEANQKPDKNPFRSATDEENKKSDHQLSLDKEILKLKQDLDEYLRIINEENEKEIKQLCAGLSKDTKLLTLQNALINKSRSSYQSDSSQNPFQPYHNLEFLTCNSNTNIINSNKSKTSIYQDVEKDESHFGSIYVKNGFNLNESQHYGSETNPFSKQKPSIRSSDPNFHFQRKPLAPNTFHQQNHSNVISSDNSANTSQLTSETSANSSSDNNNSANSSEREMIKDNLKQNLALHHPPVLIDSLKKSLVNGDKDMILEWHKNKPSIWEQYYGKNRQHHALVKSMYAGKGCKMQSIVSYVSESLLYSFL